ncbi:unnamed protein product, partial [Allacma fusca]
SNPWLEEKNNGFIFGGKKSKAPSVFDGFREKLPTVPSIYSLCKSGDYATKSPSEPDSSAPQQL